VRPAAVDPVGLAGGLVPRERLVPQERPVRPVRLAQLGKLGLQVRRRPRLDAGVRYRLWLIVVDRGGLEYVGSSGPGTNNVDVEGSTEMSHHKGEDMKGRLKQAVGDISGDEGLKREGKLDQVSAATKRAVDNVADKTKDIVDPKKK